MITTVTLNPCIDYTATVNSFQPKGFNLSSETQQDIGGKGINVSVVVNQLGYPTTAIGISFRENHQLVADYLNKQKIPNQFVLAEGSIRRNIKIIDKADNSLTEINSLGTPIFEEAVTEVSALLQYYAARSKVVVLSGRLPQNAPPDTYYRLLHLLKEYPCHVILDADGEALQEGIKGFPTLIKPNLREFEQLIGITAPSPELIVTQGKQMTKEFVDYLCISLGDKGAILMNNGRALYAKPLVVEVKSTVGAGDSMVAGIGYGLAVDASMEEMLRYGVACATATVAKDGTALATKPEIEYWWNKLEIESI